MPIPGKSHKKIAAYEHADSSYDTEFHSGEYIKIHVANAIGILVDSRQSLVVSVRRVV